MQVFTDLTKDADGRFLWRRLPEERF